MINIKSYKLSNGVKLPSILLGSYQVKDVATLEGILKSSLENGVYGFDTSPSYGNLNLFGEVLSKAVKETKTERKKLFVQSKIDGIQMCKTNGKIEKYFDDILKSLRLDYLDCLLVHWPFEKYLENTWKTFEKLYVQGKVRSIGLCNIDRDKFKSFASKVVITPQIVQNEISPAHSSRDDVEYFKANGVLVQAYSPLCRMLPFIKENKELQRLGEKYNKSIPQIILRWHYERGVAPVFTSSKPSRIVDNTDIFDFSLTSDEVELVTNQNIDYKIFLESFGCPEY